MTRIPGRGSATPIGTRSDGLRVAVSGRLGDANMQRGGIGLGRIEPGRSASAIDCEYVRLKLQTGVGDYTVRHGRGFVPGLVERVEHSSPTNMVYVVNALEQRKWTFSTVRVRVTAVAGAITTGDTILLRIGGEKAGG